MMMMFLFSQNFIMLMTILTLLNFKGQPEKQKQLFYPFLYIKKKSRHNYLIFFNYLVTKRKIL